MNSGQHLLITFWTQWHWWELGGACTISAPHVAPPAEKNYLPALLNISPTSLKTDQSSENLTAEMKVQQEPPKDKVNFLCDEHGFFG